MIKWIICFILAIIVIYFLDLLFSKRNGLLSNILSIVIKLLLAVICAFLPLGGPIFLRPIQEFLVALYVVLLGDGITGILFIFIKNLKFIYKRIISFVVILSIFLYGTINSQIINEKEYNIYSSKIDNDYSFIFMSDVHIGSSDELRIVKKTVDDIKTKDIDFLVLGGDITDDYTTKDEMEEFYSYFKDFSCDVYLIYGNHDLQLNETYRSKTPYTEEELINTIESNDIIILEDEYVIYNELMFIGRDDKSHDKNRLKNDEIVFDSSKYNIVFDHQPSNTKGTNLPTTDLQVSGHTHAGQFAPLRLLYNLFISPAYGKYEFNNTVEIVTSGVFGWRVPFKNEAHNEYLLINIKSDK